MLLCVHILSAAIYYRGRPVLAQLVLTASICACSVQSLWDPASTFTALAAIIRKVQC